MARSFWAGWLFLVPFTWLAQEPSLPVPPNVAVDGVPAIPMKLVSAVAPYGQFRRAQLVAWHPTERRMIVTTTFASVPQLHEVKFPGGARTQLTYFPDGVSPRPGAVFLPRGESIVFQKDTAGGGEANQLFRYDAATGALTLLTDGKSRNGIPVISRSGRVAYDSTRRDGKNRDLYLLDPRQPDSSTPLAETTGTWSAVDWSADEKSVLATQSMSSSESYLWRIQVPGGEKTLLTPKGERPVKWSAAFFAGGGTAIYALGNFNSESPRVFRLSGAALVTADACRPPGRSLRSQPGRPAARRCLRRGGLVSAAAARCERPGPAHAGAAGRRHLRRLVAPGAQRSRIQHRRRAVVQRRVLDRHRRKPARSLDVQRDGRRERRDAARRRDRQVEKLRRPGDLGRALPSARRGSRVRGR